MNLIDILIIIGIIVLMIVILVLIFTRFRPWVNQSVDKMAIVSFVKRNKIKTRDELIDFYWSKHKKNPANEYVLQQSLDAYDKYIK